MKKGTRWLVGIDEAGRGPLAGPVAVGVFAAPVSFDFTPWGATRDSKQLSPSERESIFRHFQRRRCVDGLRFACSQTSAPVIDRIGIVPAIHRAMASALRQIDIPPDRTAVLLDGGLQAPDEYEDQTTIIRGDASEPVIAFASIVAKVRRDRLMVRLSRQYPQYGFERHKGYGTIAHRDAIKKYGVSPIHRRSFGLQHIDGRGIVA